MSKTPSYKEATNRLDEILRHIEQENPDIDELFALVQEAVGLTKICRDRLTLADKQFEELISSLDEGK